MRKETYFSSDWIMYQAAELFFVRGLSQKEVGAQLNISPVTVSRLIQKAKDCGVVQFRICEPYMGMLELAGQLKEKYQLRDAIIAQYPNRERPELSDVKQAVALEGAKYLQRHLTAQDTVGIAWGKTMFHLINYLNPCQKTNASFVTMHGSIASCDYDLDVQTLTSRAAMALGGTKYCLFTNGLLDTPETVMQLKKEQSIQHIFEIFNSITISVSGIGAHFPDPTSLLAFPPYVTGAEYDQLRSQQVCGDIMLRFFDRDGRECDGDLKDRTLSISLETYQKIPTKLLAVTGLYKAEALHTALKNGFCDVLIVDDSLAKAVLAHP